MGQESMSECELLRAEIESLKIDLQAMLGLRRTGSTSTIEKRLERLEAIVDARGLDWDHPMVQDDHFAGANKMVADEPAKKPEPEHPAGPRPDPGEGYRLLSKDPPEELHVGDEHELSKGNWVESANARTHKRQARLIWYRRKIEQPKPAWEPKVGDWVKVTRPENWIEWRHPRWEGSMHKSDGMHKFDGQVGQIEREREGHFQIRGFVASKECSYIFHRDWLSPAEPPKPPQPEYREPVLPADAAKECQFSDDGIEWESGWLNGWGHRSHQWISHSGVHWRHCRIKKDT